MQNQRQIIENQNFSLLQQSSLLNLRQFCIAFRIQQHGTKEILIRNIVSVFQNKVKQYSNPMLFGSYQNKFILDSPVFKRYPVLKQIAQNYNMLLQMMKNPQIMRQQQQRQQQFQRHNINQFRRRKTIQRSQKASWQNQSQFQVNIHDPKQFNCVCAFFGQPRVDLENYVQCIRCRKIAHFQCMKLQREKEKPLYECPACVLLHHDALHRVTKDRSLVPPIYLCVPTNCLKDFFLDNNHCQMMASNARFGVEIRCVQINGIHHEQTWPDAGDLFINGVRVRQFQPLVANSSLKKRKDEKFFTKYTHGPTSYLKFGVNQVRITTRKLTPQDNAKYTPNAIYMMAIFLVEKYDSPRLCEFIKRTCSQPKDRCVKFIHNCFNLQDGLKMDKIVIPLKDVYDLKLIQTPARGRHCTHLQVFSLENFVYMNFKNNIRKWQCPICKRKAYDLIVDLYITQIIQEVSKEKDKEDIAEIVFHSNADYSLKREEFSDGVASDDEGGKKSGKKEGTIILDSDDEDESSRMKGPGVRNQPSTTKFRHQPSHFQNQRQKKYQNSFIPGQNNMKDELNVIKMDLQLNRMRLLEPQWESYLADSETQHNLGHFENINLTENPIILKLAGHYMANSIQTQQQRYHNYKRPQTNSIGNMEPPIQKFNNNAYMQGIQQKNKVQSEPICID